MVVAGGAGMMWGIFSWCLLLPTEHSFNAKAYLSVVTNITKKAVLKERGGYKSKQISTQRLGCIILMLMSWGGKQ